MKSKKEAVLAKPANERFIKKAKIDIIADGFQVGLIHFNPGKNINENKTFKHKELSDALAQVKKYLEE